MTETGDPAPERGAMAAVALAVLPGALGIGGANIALPDIAATSGTGWAGAQWVIAAYLLSLTTLVVGAGQLGDRFGHRRVLDGGLVLFTLASVACVAARSRPVLIAARAAQRMGSAAMLVLTPGYRFDLAADTAAVLAAAEAERKGKVSGLLTLSRNRGLITGAAAMVLQGLGATFSLSPPSFPAVRSLPRWPRRGRRGRPDRPGTAPQPVSAVPRASCTQRGVSG